MVSVPQTTRNPPRAAGDEQATPDRLGASLPPKCNSAVLYWVHPVSSPLPLSAGTTRIGRGSTCQLQLDGAGVSRLHAELYLNEDTLLISDFSKHGTRVNAKPVTRQVLRNGDVLRIGEHVAIVLISSRVALRPFGPIEGKALGSSALSQVFERVKRVAGTNLCVLIEGESGSGKEAVARSLHQLGERPGNFVAVNCAALPSSLLESELFGYEKGTFTGATAARRGLIQQADGGTLFLDEVGELSLEGQAKLLRVIQEGTLIPLGGREPVAVTVRWVAATHRDLQRSVEANLFRFDLYQRLAGVTIEVPSLRARKEDILPLFRYLIEPYPAGPPQLTEALVEALCCYSWPGNVRELEQAAKGTRALVDAGLPWDIEHLPRAVQAALEQPAGSSLEVRSERHVADERGLHPSSGSRDSSATETAGLRTAAPGRTPLTAPSVLQALRSAHGNVSEAASLLRASRQAVHAAINRYELGDTHLQIRANSRERKRS